MRSRSITQSHPTFYDPMDCSLPSSSIHEIFQAIIPEWAAINCSRGSSQSRDQTHVSCISCTDRWILYHWATWEASMLHTFLILPALPSPKQSGLCHRDFNHVSSTFKNNTHTQTKCNVDNSVGFTHKKSGEKYNYLLLWKDWCWSWNSNTLATWCKELTHWKRPWC